MPPICRILAVSVAIGLPISAYGATSLLSTDFAGISINGTTDTQMDNITWSGTALSAPTTLSLENVVYVGGDSTPYMDNGTVQVDNGYYGAYTNISSGSPSNGQWGVTVQITIGASDISLSDVLLNVTHGNSSGAFQNNSRSTNVAISVVDTVSALTVGSANHTYTIPGSTNEGLDESVVFSSPLSLAAGRAYDVSFLVDSDNNNGGHFAAFGSIDFNGTVPEPSVALLGGLGALLLLRRRRG